MKLNNIDEVWNSANLLSKWIFGLLSSKNFATMTTWRNDFSSLLWPLFGRGYTLEIKELIEAGVFFSAKNLGHQNIRGSMDTFSKDMINDVVHLQQEQVTIMTQGQGKFNVIKQWMTATNDAMDLEARGSSVYSWPVLINLDQHSQLMVKFPIKTTCSFTPNSRCIRGWKSNSSFQSWFRTWQLSTAKIPVETD